MNLKKAGDFKIIGTSRKNVDGQKIVTGQPLFGLDYKQDGMLIAMIVHPTAFGSQFKETDVSAIKSMPGIVDAFFMDVYKGEKQWCDVAAFNKLLAIVGKTTWQVMQAKKTFQGETEPIKASSIKQNVFGTDVTTVTPAGFENTASHKQQMAAANKKIRLVRKDGDPEAMFKKAATVIERSYSCPFLGTQRYGANEFFCRCKRRQGHINRPGANTFLYGKISG